MGILSNVSSMEVMRGALILVLGLGFILVAVGAFFFIYLMKRYLNSAEYGDVPFNRAEVVNSFRQAKTKAEFLKAIDDLGGAGLWGSEEDKAANRAFRRFRKELTHAELQQVYWVAEPDGLLEHRTAACLRPHEKVRFG